MSLGPTMTRASPCLPPNPLPHTKPCRITGRQQADPASHPDTIEVAVGQLWQWRGAHAAACMRPPDHACAPIHAGTLAAGSI